tara:strand:- start:497 stop:1102 length:606 start_codon:yes stop_codon:yes gene_type:complete
MNNELVCLNTPDASHRLILLHGWGADAEDLLPLGEQLICQLTKKTEIIALRAPGIHPQGIGKQWYPLFPTDWSAVPIAIDNLKERIQDIASPRIPLKKTAILGFSQGAAMTLESGCDLPLAGLICCSAYPHSNWLAPKSIPPIFLTHGKNDEIVPAMALQKILSLLEKHNELIDIELFDGGHEIPQYLIPKFQLFLEKCFE